MKYIIKAKDKKGNELYLQNFGGLSTAWTSDKNKAMSWPYSPMAETIAIEFENAEVVEVFEKRDMECFVLPCNCGSEHLVFSVQPDDTVEVSIWRYAYHKQSFWNRFRHIWYILRHGTPYTDQIVLDEKRQKDLYKFMRNKTLGC